MRPAFLVLAAIVLSVGTTQAQGTPKEQSACRADAKRFCKASLDSGQLAVGMCLMSNKGRLSARCRAVLASHGM